MRHGLSCFSGDAVAIVMADGSDSPQDLVAYQRVLEAGYDCAFGVANRIVNWSIRALFRHGYGDTTNASRHTGVK